jgi:hypothetical protein
MVTWHTEGDAAENLLERRWFAANTAAARLRAECEVLRDVMELAQAEWRGARARLDRLEALRDALGDDLANLDGQQVPMAAEVVDPGVMSAA